MNNKLGSLNLGVTVCLLLIPFYKLMHKNVVYDLVITCLCVASITQKDYVMYKPFMFHLKYFFLQLYIKSILEIIVINLICLFVAIYIKHKVYYFNNAVVIYIFTVFISERE